MLKHPSARNFRRRPQSPQRWALRYAIFAVLATPETKHVNLEEDRALPVDAVGHA